MTRIRDQRLSEPERRRARAPVSRLACLFAVLAIHAAAVAGFGLPAQAGSKVTVLELFTSQGCSSCPPADALLRKMSRDEGILALSFPVDYWDYLGWKDTLALHENTLRQQAYASGRGDRSVYTPQVVINGREHAVGSDRQAIMRAVKRQARTYGAMAVDVALAATGDRLRVDIGETGKAMPGVTARVWLVAFARERTVKIARGENRGATITYTNVVRRMIPIGEWTGRATTLHVARDAIKARSGFDHCAVIVQRFRDGYPAEIVGASDAMAFTGS